MVLIGEVLQAAVGQNPARQVALGAGMPDTVTAVTLNQVCGSGLTGAMFADQAIRAGEASLVLAGGIESMSNAPFFVKNMRTGSKFGDQQLADGMLHDGLTCPFEKWIMGCAADETAKKAGVSREEQDQYAANSQQLAAAALAEGIFKAETSVLEVPAGRKKTVTFEADETVRGDTTAEALAKLPPVFNKDGTVTAGNASQLADGAAMVLVASEEAIQKHSLTPMARIISQATAGTPPRDLFFAPIQAVKMVVERAGLQRKDIDLFEINEAFAAQMLACLKGLELTADRVNVHGGGIALGHPIGASGARVLATLLHTLKRRNLKRGVASLCLGGGNAVAMAVEMV
jgi:acetyl-CoA C-acetyltransferase